jgi:predicted DNA-binding WGR domain protein
MFETPTQLIDYRCELEAVDRSRNIARAYHIHASRDLFGHIIVDLRWGRIGRRGAGLTISFADEEAARRFIRRTLAKRASAPQRIGTAYQLVNGLSALKTRHPTLADRLEPHIG